MKKVAACAIPIRAGSTLSTEVHPMADDRRPVVWSIAGSDSGGGAGETAGETAGIGRDTVGGGRPEVTEFDVTGMGRDTAAVGFPDATAPAQVPDIDLGPGKK